MNIGLILDSKKPTLPLQITFITLIIHLVHLFQIVCRKFRLWFLGYIPFGFSLNEKVRTYSARVCLTDLCEEKLSKHRSLFQPNEEYSL